MTDVYVTPAHLLAAEREATKRHIDACRTHIRTGNPADYAEVIRTLGEVNAAMDAREAGTRIEHDQA